MIFRRDGRWLGLLGTGGQSFLERGGAQENCEKKLTKSCQKHVFHLNWRGEYAIWMSKSLERNVISGRLIGRFESGLGRDFVEVYLQVNQQFKKTFTEVYFVFVYRICRQKVYEDFR